jgi:hypothetical protein
VLVLEGLKFAAFSPTSSGEPPASRSAGGEKKRTGSTAAPPQPTGHRHGPSRDVHVGLG